MLFRSLVGNAVKFTREGSVTIAVDGQAEDDGRVRLAMEVTDTGIGIALKDQGRIFEDFTQADSSIMNRFGGTGLGLAITRRLVELLGGAIAVESIPREGSTFRFHVPVTALADESQVGEEPWSARGVTLVCQDAAALPAVVEALSAIGITPVIADPRQGPARLFTPQSATTVRLFYEPDSHNLALRADGASAGLPKAVLIRPNAVSALPGMATRQRYASVVSDRPTADELRRVLTIASRLAAPAPSQATPAPSQAAPLRMTRPARPRRVLLADDNRINQRVFSRILEGAGHTVLLAETGDQALDRLEEQAGQIDIVLMDFNMPDTDGLEATKLYRMMATGERRLPIIGLTADATALTDSRWRDAGMDDCLIKPIEPAALLAAVDRLARDEAGPEMLSVPRPASVLAETLPSLDERAIESLRRLGGAEFVTELMQDYLADAESMLDRLIASATAGDLTMFRSEAHALQSSSANIGAFALGRLCEPWRDLRGEELRARSPEFTRQAKAELMRTRRAMHAYATRETGPA